MVEGHAEALVDAVGILEREGVGTGTADRDLHACVVAQAPRGEIGAVEVQAEIAGIQLAGIGDVQVGVDIAGVAVLRQDPERRDVRIVDVAEQVGAGLARQV